ncbi:MAG: D-alanine--D-alanine ligase [Planctomycetota bacterium]|nr:D-alanine--D-alanine ligase [Planctomycetota bacterium]
MADDCREPDSLHVTVLMGGPSSEREVSLVSGGAVAAALESVGHRVRRADIQPNDASALDAPGIDVVFIALHGEFGEDGKVQALCEARGLAYTGSNPRASELAMDKAAAKQIVRRHGVDTPDWIVIEEYRSPGQAARQVAELSLPVVVKPVTGGSSVDVTIARDAGVRDAAIEAALDKYGRVMVEQFIAGGELTVGILGDQALPVIQIVPKRAFYDFTAKYADDAGTEYLFDFGVAPGALRAIQASALAVNEALGCRDMGRVDFILDAAGRAWMLEVNTIPGFTGHSLLPMAARRSGVEFPQLVDRLVRMAYSRRVQALPSAR